MICFHVAVCNFAQPTVVVLNNQVSVLHQTQDGVDWSLKEDEESQPNIEERNRRIWWWRMATAKMEEEEEEVEESGGKHTDEGRTIRGQSIVSW